MNKEKAKEVYEEISDGLKLKFKRYYKYGFTYEGENGGVKVTVTLGGNYDDIYRHEVDTNEFKAPKVFEALMEIYFDVTIEKDGEVFSDYHY